MTDEQKSHRYLLSAALRSGKYRQGVGVLKYIGGELCFLGVACEVFHEQTKLGRWEAAYVPCSGAPIEAFRFCVGREQSAIALPKKVKEWYGFIGDGVGLQPHSGLVRNATGMNDNGCTFVEMADALDATP